MREPQANEVGVPAEQPQVVEESNGTGAQIAHPQVAATMRQISVANYQVPPPEKFSFKPEGWPRWIRRFERFRKATGFDQKDGENQVNTLIYSMGEEADDIVVSFGPTAAEAKQYDIDKGKFESHFVVKRNVIFEQVKFNLRSQNDNESVDTFITDLYCLAE